MGGAKRADATKAERFNSTQVRQREARETLIMKRRGLNFVTEHHEELVEQNTIESCEKQLDNVAPKIVGLLGLGESVDTEAIRQQLIKHCFMYTEGLKSKKEKKNDIDNLMEEIEEDLKAYVCPNPGSAANLASKKQRLIFINIDRNDPYSVMDAGKVVDLMVVIMSCKNANVVKLRDDPYEQSNAIDEIGYKNLSLIRS